VPFPLIGDVVPRGREDGRHVRQVAGEDALGQGEAGAEAERVDDPVLGREIAGEEGGAAGGAHAAIAEGAVEGETVLAEAGHARQVPLLPARRKVLAGPLLVGQEENYIHPGDALRGGGRLREPGLEGGKGEGRGAEEIAALQVHGHGRP